MIPNIPPIPESGHPSDEAIAHMDSAGAVDTIVDATNDRQIIPAVTAYFDRLGGTLLGHLRRVGIKSVAAAQGRRDRLSDFHNASVAASTGFIKDMAALDEIEVAQKDAAARQLQEVPIKILKVGHEVLLKRRRKKLGLEPMKIDLGNKKTKQQGLTHSRRGSFAGSVAGSGIKTHPERLNRKTGSLVADLFPPD